MNERSRLINDLKKNIAARVDYTSATTSINVASQIKALRRRRDDMTQEELAKESGIPQPRISAIERPGNMLSLSTLVKVASAFKVGLIVKFVPFSEMVQWENSYSQDRFDATPIERDADFLEPKSIESPQQASSVDTCFALHSWLVSQVSAPEGSRFVVASVIKTKGRDLGRTIFAAGRHSSIDQVGTPVNTIPY